MLQKTEVEAFIAALDEYTDARIKLATDKDLVRDRDMEMMGWGGGDRYKKAKADLSDKREKLVQAVLVITGNHVQDEVATLTLC